MQFSFLVQKYSENTTYLIPFAFLKPSGKKIRIIQFQHSKGEFNMFPEEAQESVLQNTGQLTKK